MLPVDGTYTIWEIPLVEEPIRNGTPVILAWHRHEFRNQAVPDDHTHLNDDAGYSGEPHTVTKTNGPKRVPSGKVSVIKQTNKKIKINTNSTIAV